MSKHWSNSEIVQKIMRPRVLIYSGVLLLMCVGFAVSLSVRPSFMVDVVRDRGVMSRLTEEGNVENVYQLQITNVTESPETYRIKATGLNGLSIASNSQIMVNPTADRKVAVALQVPDGTVASGTYPIIFEIESMAKKEFVAEKSIFYMPR